MDDGPVTADAAARRQYEILDRCEAANARAREAVQRAEAALATSQDRLRRAQAILAAIGATQTRGAESARRGLTGRSKAYRAER